MKSLYFFLLSALICLNVNSQNTYVPDDNFEQALIDLGYDSGALDDYVPTANINSITWLNVENKGISDLTGIQDFTALISLEVSDNNLTSVDISNNIALIYFECYTNGLTNIDVSNNTALTTLKVSNNNISNLDVSNNIALTHLATSHNNLTILDVSSNIELTLLEFYHNSLSNLDLSNNVDLEYLLCRYNNMISLDLSHNLELKYISCELNNLTSLDLSNNTLLERLYCGSNNIDRLNLVHNQSLEILHCDNNELIGINLKNGKNADIIEFYATSNPDLECIQVDDPAYSTANWTNIDSTSSFRSNCRYVATYGNRIQEEPVVLENEYVSIYPNPVRDELSVSIQTDASYSLFNINGQLLKEGVLLKGETTLDVSQLNSGLFFINVLTSTESFTKKIVKK